MTLLLAGHETTATGAGVDARPADAPPGRARARAQAGGDDVPARGRRRVAALRPVVPLAGRRLVSDLRRRRRSTLPAGHRRHAGDLAHPHARRRLPGALRVPARALPRRAAATYTWIPFGGGVRRCLGAAFAELEMRVVLGEILRRFDLRAAGRRAERVARRNVTFSPRHGTRVIARPRRST